MELLSTPLRHAPYILRRISLATYPYLTRNLNTRSPSLTMPKRKYTQVAAEAEVKEDHGPAASGEEAIAAATAAIFALSEPMAGFPSPSASPRRTSARARKQAPPAEEPDSPLGELEDEFPAKKKRLPRKKAKTAATRDESPLTDLEEPVKKKRTRRKKVADPVVYDIPPVERKETQFTGRLGYACLNTIMRAMKPEPVFCSRTCRLDTIKKNGIEFAKDLGLRNARDLKAMIEVRQPTSLGVQSARVDSNKWNEQNKIRFFRMSSEMFPFASHKIHGYDLDYAREELMVS